jgi:hypothetical protein
MKIATTVKKSWLLAIDPASTHLRKISIFKEYSSMAGGASKVSHETPFEPAQRPHLEDTLSPRKLTGLH